MLIMKNCSYVCVHVRASLSLHASLEHKYPNGPASACGHQQQRDVRPSPRPPLLEGKWGIKNFVNKNKSRHEEVKQTLKL